MAVQMEKFELEPLVGYSGFMVLIHLIICLFKKTSYTALSTFKKVLWKVKASASKYNIADSTSTENSK